MGYEIEEKRSETIRNRKLAGMITSTAVLCKTEVFVGYKFINRGVERRGVNKRICK